MVEKIAPSIDAQKEIEILCRRHIKSKTLTDDAFTYMSKLILEDCPRNASELCSLIQDFLTDGMTYSEEEAFKICDIIQKILIEKKLVVVVQRDTIVAEKLNKAVTMSQMQHGGNAVRDEDFLDPYIGMERQKAKYNTQFDKGKLAEVAKKDKTQQADALDKKIAEFLEHKQKVPPPEVRHDKGNNFKQDIMIPNVTLIVGGKALLD